MATGVLGSGFQQAKRCEALSLEAVSGGTSLWHLSVA